jgi:hypothetical protein
MDVLGCRTGFELVAALMPLQHSQKAGDDRDSKPGAVNWFTKNASECFRGSKDLRDEPMIACSFISNF